MTSDPDQIREQIEETCTSLSQDVNSLADTAGGQMTAGHEPGGGRPPG